MNKISYELIQDRETVGSILDRIFEFGSEITISEDTVDKRTVFKANIVFVNHFNYEMVLKPSNIGMPFSFSGNYRVYVTNRDECMHFTCSLGNISSARFLILRWPVSIYQQNTRRAKRINLEDREFMVNFSNFSLNSDSVEKTFREAKLVDISKTGLGLSVDEDIANFLKENDRLIFTYINEIPLQDILTGNIVYIRKINPIMASNNYTVGIQFNEEIKFNEILQSLGQKTEEKEDIDDLKRLF